MAQAVVEKSLSALLEKYSIPPYSDGDDVLYTYIAGAMEELGNEEDLEDFDLDSFLEMMEAYIPGFQDIMRQEVEVWMLTLAAEIKEADPSGLNSNDCGENGETTSNTLPEPQELQGDSAGSQEGSEACSEAGSDEGVDGRADERSDEMEVEIQNLLECFPSSCHLEVEHCLSVSQGDMEQAAQLILLRQETDQSILPYQDKNRTYGQDKASKKGQKGKKKSQELGDNDLKNLVLEKYSFVDMDEDRRTHRPAPLKEEPKKMVRYRDSQVVSMKGERFSEIKKTDPEKLKETYVNLKPARKYLFH